MIANLSSTAGLLALLGSAMPMTGQTSLAPGLVKSEFIFAAGDVPFAECHASTLAQSQGRLVAAWFGGTGEGHSDVCIWLSRLDDGKWLAPVKVAAGSDNNKAQPCWNPVLFQPSTGPLLLFYKVGPSPRQWWGMLATSADGGKTWSTPRPLPEGILGPIKDKPVELTGGELLCPSSTEDHGWRIHFERTRDLGQTWDKTGPLNDGKEFSAIQPTILFHSGGRLQALGRTRQARIFQIWSQDGGKSWGPMTATALPNPNSGLDAVTLRTGSHLLVYNHTTNGRSPLNVALSRDGQQWEAALVLEDSRGEFSYPAVIQTADSLVHIAYTWKRRSIKHAVVDPTALVLRPMPGGNWPTN